MYNNIFKFVSNQKELLKLEKLEHENRKTSSTINVSCLQVGNSLLGKYQLTLKFIKGKIHLLPLLKVGQVISLFTLNTEKNDNEKSFRIKGVISGNIDRYTFNAIVENFDISMTRENSNDIGLNIVTDDVTFKSYSWTLDKLEAVVTKPLPCENILQVAFGDRSPEFIEKFQLKELFNKKLNEVQKQSVRFALSSKSICCTIGPPGTGKTTMATELALQALINEKKSVLIVAPSNIAVDNIAEKLGEYSSMFSKKNIRVCRLGHPARMKESILNFSLDYLVSKNMGKDARHLRREIDQNLKKLGKTKKYGEKKTYRRNISKLKKELRVFERSTVRSVIDNSNCVLATLTGCVHVTKDKSFDLVIIDECAQSMEIASWNALVRGKSAVLVGDFKQLGPTILNVKVEKKLSLNLMERLCLKYKKKICKMLTIQYRMNEEIMQWSSDMFYDGKLIANNNVQEHLLCDLDYVEEIEETSTPLFFIDTSAIGFYETVGVEESKYNEGEVQCIEKYLNEIINAGVKERDIGIISFYSAQVQTLKNKFGKMYSQIEIKTVDGFQGREKEVIILSMVRSNKMGEVGFLKEARRINVAYTRGRRSICVVGDSNTLKKDKVLGNFVKYLNLNADVRPAEDYLDDDE